MYPGPPWSVRKNDRGQNIFQQFQSKYFDKYLIRYNLNLKLKKKTNLSNNEIENEECLHILAGFYK